MYQQTPRMSQVAQVPQKKSLFKEKVLVCKEKFQDIRADAVINFCTPTVMSGPSFFNQLHEMAGPELMESCRQFAGLAPTSCRVTSSFNATNFKLVAHTVVPSKLDLTKEIDLHSIYLCVRNSLDRASEDGAKTIAFPPYFPSVDLPIGCEIILRIFTDWIHRSIYSDQIVEIRVMCSTEREYNSYVDAAKSLYLQANTMQQQYMRPKTVVIPTRYLSDNRFNRPKRIRRTFDQPPLEAPPIKLDLSAKLSPSILALDDENGMKRLYRLTNRSRDGRKLYFRCSRCDTLIKKDGQRIRAKLIVQDGHIVSERFPEHHPECTPKSQEDVFMQQIDRSSRREVKEGFLLPQDAYKKAVSRVLEESAREQEVSGAVEKFPEWHRLRQQYCRIRKTALTKQYRDEGYDYTQKYPVREYKPARRYSPSQYGRGGAYADEDGGSGYAMMKTVGPVKGEEIEEEDGPIVVDDDMGVTKDELTPRQYIPAQEAAEMVVEESGRIPRKE
ncbi:macro domain-containing protein [Ditylenchus destructor]|uniref:Macro domain-containing protein n=1 Tax=Ditylenchus destructor TaxID=166010 RepID=A0AAD4R0U2_9BILA|nr:macro domain-containing protein [Ditylenchus destructor]